MKNIEIELKNYLENAKEPIQEVFFIPDAKHPVWDDNLEIIQLANQQILQSVGSFPNEKIFAFIGMHAKTAITGNRDSVGFLITNYRILMQTDFSIIGTAQNAKTFSFTQTQIPAELSAKMWNDFSITNTLSINQEQLFALQTALKDSVGIILPALQHLKHLPEELKKSNNINERIKDLGLQKILKNYDEEKYLKKFASKHNIPNIMFGIVDKPFFMGVYGLVISKNGITSRDLMEDIVSSTWAEIKQNPASISSKDDEVLAGQKNHIIPPIYAKSIPPLIVIINEIANAEIVI